jgi:hypothetical protein
MTIHYHGTPITPRSVLHSIPGRHYCVSYACPQDVEECHRIGQSVMLDNGAFSNWRVGRQTDWPGYYAWCDRWLDYPETWAVIPDVITGTDEDQDALIDQWPHGDRGAPVWHMHEKIDRLIRLTDQWPRVCIGSSAQYSELLTPQWRRRMDACWNALMGHHTRVPRIHMLRGMQLVRFEWPFASVDSTDIARNHNRRHNSAKSMVERWDAAQCPPRWSMAALQLSMIEAAK